MSLGGVRARGLWDSVPDTGRKGEDPRRTVVGEGEVVGEAGAAEGR